MSKLHQLLSLMFSKTLLTSLLYTAALPLSRLFCLFIFTQNHPITSLESRVIEIDNLSVSTRSYTLSFALSKNQASR